MVDAEKKEDLSESWSWVSKFDSFWIDPGPLREDSLAFAHLRSKRPTLKPGEVEVRVEAIGLNFRDVLNVTWHVFWAKVTGKTVRRCRSKWEP